MSIIEKLAIIQQELIAPKNQYNSFGKYNYRSCEDILEGLKPCLKKVEAAVTVSDEIVQIGERYYIKATATLRDSEGAISNTAYAREEENKKGMDASQVTGATSSYARKYALNGLFCIDDVKDADARENRQEEAKIQKKAEEELAQKASPAKIKTIKQLCDKYNVNAEKLLSNYKTTWESMTEEIAAKILLKFKEQENKK